MDQIYNSKDAKMSMVFVIPSDGLRKSIPFSSPEEEQPGLLASTKGRRRKKATFNVCQSRVTQKIVKGLYCVIVLFRYESYGLV